MSGGVERTEGDVTATAASEAATGGERIDEQGYLSGLRLDYAFAILMLWQATGGVLDIRKHAEGFSFAEEGLVTPEHTMMWTGFLALLAMLFGVTIKRRFRGEDSWISAIPPGYEMGFLGMLLWAMAVPGDMYWHVLFGTEESFTALLSPTHLTLGLGAVLFLSSPLRATWRRRFEDSWRSLFPAVVSATFALGVFTMFTMYAHPTFLSAGVDAGGLDDSVLGVVAFLVQMPILAGICCLLVRRFDVPPGAFTLLFAVNGSIMVAMGRTNNDAAIWFFAAFIVAGLLADGLSTLFGRMRYDTAKLRLFCAAIPAAWAATHLAIVEFQLGGIAWTTHTWTGTVFLSTAAGMLVSVLVAPSPHDPDVDHRSARPE